MGIWSALSGLTNVETQAANAGRRAKATKQASAAKAAGRGKRNVIGKAPAPAKTRRGW